MNEVEKMYENARVEAKRNYYCPECESLLEDWYSGDDYIEYRCTDCEYAVDNRMEELNTLKFIDIYPPFTAEKQLELVKWLLEKWMDVRFVHNSDGIYYISSFNNVSYTGKNLEECIVSFVNNAWQSLTDADKAQIRGILE